MVVVVLVVIGLSCDFRVTARVVVFLVVVIIVVVVLVVVGRK